MGESKSLEILNIDYLNGSIVKGTDNISHANLELLGKACGLNAKRKGLL